MPDLRFDKAVFRINNLRRSKYGILEGSDPNHSFRCPTSRPRGDRR